MRKLVSIFGAVKVYFGVSRCIIMLFHSNSGWTGLYADYLCI